MNGGRDVFIQKAYLQTDLSEQGNRYVDRHIERENCEGQTSVVFSFFFSSSTRFVFTLHQSNQKKNQLSILSCSLFFLSRSSLHLDLLLPSSSLLLHLSPCLRGTSPLQISPFLSLSRKKETSRLFGQLLLPPLVVVNLLLSPFLSFFLSSFFFLL